jgi:hypothetical protein
MYFIFYWKAKVGLACLMVPVQYGCRGIVTVQVYNQITSVFITVFLEENKGQEM